MQLVKEVTRALPLNTLPFDITRSTQAIFMAEVLYRVVKEEETNPMLASYLVSTIQYLDTMEETSPDFHIIFMFQLSRHLGFYPQNNYGKERPIFNLANGRFNSHFKDPEVDLDRDASSLWHRYMNTDIQKVSQEGFNGSQRKTTLDNLVRYYKMHISGLGEIRSLEILHAYFVK
jgi:DNA repair protein RecO (recombination protein O)